MDNVNLFLTENQQLEITIALSLDYENNQISSLDENTSLSLHKELLEYHQFYKQESPKKESPKKEEETVEVLEDVSLDERLERKKQKAIDEGRFIDLDEDEPPQQTLEMKKIPPKKSNQSNVMISQTHQNYQRIPNSKKRKKSDDIFSFTVVELKSALKTNSLKVSGNKSELIDRLLGK
jgi:hypothetical protein